MNRTLLFAAAVFVAALVSAGAGRVHGQSPQVPPTAQDQAPAGVRVSALLPAHAQTPPQAPAPAVARVQKPKRLSADQAYRANCTRCHSELPKLDARAMKTVLMHMRVRGNIPQDDARAILDYLTR